MIWFIDFEIYKIWKLGKFYIEVNLKLSYICNYHGIL